MAIQIFNDGIAKDTNVLGNNTYLDNGQGCGTIWFKNVPSARKALNRDGVKSGRDLFDCTECSCHYSNSDKNYSNYPDHACKQAKKDYAQQFDPITKKENF